MRGHTRFEVRIGSALIGAIMLLLAVVVSSNSSGDALHYILAARGRDDDWGLVMALLGSMTLYGSLRPKRACRQIGLLLSAMMLAAVFGLVLMERWLTLSTGLVLLLCVACLVLLAADTIIGSRARVNAA